MEIEERLAASSEFGKLLRRYRLAAGLSQEALAERARLSSHGISALERGYRRLPQRETLALLAGALALNSEQRKMFESAASRPSGPRRGSLTVGPWPDGAATYLPLSLTSFVGRTAELAQIASLIREQRLVTIIGAGGVGKTQTALRVASAWSDAADGDVGFVALAPIHDPNNVVPTLAAALGLQQVPNRPLLEIIVAYLKNRPLLLILDNCEHVIVESAAVVERILSACSRVRILATSREPLKSAGEYAFRLPSLSAESAAELFAERARAVDHNFVVSNKNSGAVAVLCRQLDGIPLAIELAAARINILSVESLVEELGHRFRVLSGGGRRAPPRQQTMRATIDWSYELLSGSEQRVFERLSIFAGGAALAAASEVCAGHDIAKDDVFELLSLLVDKSLVVADLSANEPRYRLLEPFRQYAVEKLAARREYGVVAHAHARECLKLAQRAEHAYELEPDAVRRAIWQSELDNWRVALRWALTEGKDIPLGQRLAAELRGLWLAFPRDGRRWLSEALEMVNEQTPACLLGKLKGAHAYFSVAFEDEETMLTSGAAAIDLCERAGDPLGLALARACAGRAYTGLGSLEEARRLLEQALAIRALGDRRLVVDILRFLVNVAGIEGDFVEARQHAAAGLRCARALRHDEAAALCILSFSSIERWSGNFDAGLSRSSEALAAFRSFEPFAPKKLIIAALSDISASLICLGRYEEAAAFACEELSLAHEFQFNFALGNALRYLAMIATFLQDKSDRSTRARVNAARMIGFVEARLDTGRTSWTWFDCPERREYVRAQTLLSDELGNDVFVEQMAEGAALTEDEIIKEAASWL